MKVLMLLHEAFGGRGGIAKFNRDLITSICAHRDVRAVMAIPRLVTDPTAPPDPTTDPSVDPNVDPTPPRRPRPSTGPVQYKGDDLEAERGPGLGCFRFQLVILAIFIVLTPLSVVWKWPSWISAALLFAVIGLLLVTGQTIIFLLRLVAAERRATGRRRPLASRTKTVGELEDERGAEREPARPDDDPDSPEPGPDEQGRVRQ